MHTADRFFLQATSAETNVASVVSHLGEPTLVLTAFVKGSPVSALIKADLRKRNMSYEGPEIDQGDAWGFRHQFNIADSGFGPGPFAVYCPMMTALLARADEDLDWLCAELGGEPSGRGLALREGLMRHLYNGELQRFSFYDAAASRRVEADVVGAYMPAMLSLPVSSLVRDRLRAGYATEWPLPTTAPSSPDFDPVRYWRGPTWININWLLADCLPGLRERSLELIERTGFFEYFHPHTGEGLGTREFTWTAALALDWLRQGTTP